MSARLTEARLSRYPNAMLLMPVAPKPGDWAALPHGSLIKSLFARKIRKAGDSFQIRIGAQAQTLLTVASVPDEASVFQRLQSAGKLARSGLEGEPNELFLWQQGLSAAVADAAQCAVVAALQAAAFAFADFKSKPKARVPLANIDVMAGSELKSLEHTLATQAGNNLARWLTALPPNELDARGFRRLLEELARHLGVTYTFYGEGRLRRLGAGAFLAVAQGNATRDAGIAHLAYRPGRKRPTPALSLVGKGVCFDTGGTNLKPHKSMLDMHTDMEGAAVAVGSLYALHALRSASSVDVWLAITENKIGPLAYKPQDVVRAMNGTTIQVIHTDAEGRMILADALCLAASKRPAAIIDYATLTGAAVYALTERYSGAFTNRPQTRDSIEAAGTQSGERVWLFPMDDDYDSDLESVVADVVQCTPDGKGDHIYAARFLSRFVPKEIPWLHLDLAAGSRTGGLAHIATDITGFGVRYTLALLERGWPQVAGGHE